MSDFEPKKNALLHILQIFQKYSDCDHLLTQDDILRYLARDYGIELERKAVGRNISYLKEAGVEIESSKQGSYLSYRDFDDSELRLLVDGVLASRYITAKHSKQLIEKLCNLSTVYFRSHVKNVCSVDQWSKSDNSQFFLNISLVDEAIEGGKQISFTYNRYGTDKRLHKGGSHCVSPYQLILHNQRYYLMAYHEEREHMSYFRLDKITNITVLDSPATELRSIEGYKHGIDYKRFSSALPYMFSDEPELITFSIDGDWMIDQIVDWFGFDFKIEDKDEKKTVTVKASPLAMEYWAMQYLNNVEVLSPLSLREKIKDNLKKAQTKYAD